MSSSLTPRTRSARSTTTPADSREGGFTLLEIMVTIAIIGGSVAAILVLRENSIVKFYEARNDNDARYIYYHVLE